MSTADSVNLSGTKGTRPPDDRAIRAWIRLLRVTERMRRRLTEQVREHGLTLGQFDVLAQIALAEGLTQQELADRLLVTKGNVSQLLDKLQREGLVERRTERGRACYLYLTPAGRSLHAAVLPPHERVIRERFAVLTPAELTTLHELLRKLDRSTF